MAPVTPWVLLLLVVACGTPCESATCLADRAVAEWTTDAPGVTARVRAIPDELTRTVVVGRLCEAYPGATRALCDALPPGPSRDRCERINNRPHLSVLPGAASIGVGAAAGEVPGDAPRTDRPVKPKAPSFPEARLPLPELAVPVADPCAEVPDRSACLDRAAVEAVLRDAPAEADAICAGHAEARWADECRFSAAEQGVRARHGDAYPAAATLCGVSISFAHECWAHVLTRLPRAVPPPNAGEARARVAIALARTVAETWAPAGREAADAHVARFWALYFANAYRQSQDPDGTPLRYYPEEAWPHVRAAATLRLHALGRLRGTLSEQLTGLRAALARQQAVAAARGQGADLVYVPDLGAPATDGPTTYYLGAPRRALGADEAQDLTFCLIESAARQPVPDTALLDEVAAGPDARAAAEARRLLGALAEAPD